MSLYPAHMSCLLPIFLYAKVVCNYEAATLSRPCLDHAHHGSTPAIASKLTPPPLSGHCTCRLSSRPPSPTHPKPRCHPSGPYPNPSGANDVSPLVYAFAGSEWRAAGQAGAQHGICSRQVWPCHLPRKYTSTSSGPGREAAVWRRQRLGRQGLLL